MARPVFKTATEMPSAAPVGSIPTRSRHALSAGVVLALFLFLGPGTLSAQAAGDSSLAPASRDRTVIGAKGAFLRSLLVPGWGQALLDRRLTAGLFVIWEGITLGMTLKTSQELGHLERIGSARADAKRSERQDWLILLAFNHLFSGLEAFVSSQLADFPDDVKFRALPGGGFAVTGQVPVSFP